MMANYVKYSTNSQTRALKMGNFWLGPVNDGKGPTSSTGYYTALPPDSGGFTIYINKASGGPAIYKASNESQLVLITNKIGNQSFTTSGQCLTWYVTQTDKFCVNREYEGIVTDGLVLNLDAGFTPSYPTLGTSWYDLSTNSYNGTLTNGPTFNSSGYVSLDGIDDYVNIGNRTNLQMGTGDFTMCLWVKMNNPPNTYGNPYINVLFNCKDAAAATAGYGITFFYDNYQAGWKNKLLWSTGNGGTAVEILTQNAFPQLLDSWGHIVMVRQNGSTNNGCFYVNGTYEPISSSATVLNVNTTTNMTLGNTSDRYSKYWTKGDFGIAQIYNRALSATEVLQNYNAQKGRFGL